MKKVLLGLLIAGTTQMAMADYSPVDKLKKLYTYQNSAIIQLGTVASSSQCTFKDNFIIPDITGTNKALYSAVLSAYVSGQPVKIGFTPTACASIWGGSVATAYSVSFSK